ncbi:hypothetical protein F9Y90_04515 (plasmid) [Borrelia miyamotoi]|uniref:hypothetical protein n=1 Tax=Borrelia miyamotoi TaxID=47466 RepID=UPI00126583D5|nr:hypothetical protein [Borrelia miyamotoi]QFP42377.1 hypothetical protein F9Y90_04515 [Borrelia miyamotoi]
MKKFSILFVMSVIICICVGCKLFQFSSEKVRSYLTVVNESLDNDSLSNKIEEDAELSKRLASSLVILDNLIKNKDEMQKIDRSYSELKDKVEKYRLRFSFQESEFSSDLSSLIVLFRAVGMTFEHIRIRYNIYATLGYNLTIIGQLKKILNHLSLNTQSIDRSLAYDLLVLLSNVTNFARLIVDVYLRDLKLAKIATKDKVITQIYYQLDEFIIRREYLIERMKGMISLVASKTGDKLEMLEILGRELDKDSEIVKMVNLLQEIKYKIEMLTWTWE